MAEVCYDDGTSHEEPAVEVAPAPSAPSAPVSQPAGIPPGPITESARQAAYDHLECVKVAKSVNATDEQAEAVCTPENIQKMKEATQPKPPPTYVKPYDGPTMGADNRTPEERAEAVKRVEEQKKKACENYENIPPNQRPQLSPEDQAYCYSVAEEREDHDPHHAIGKDATPKVPPFVPTPYR